jgi:hypothetical protein
MFVKSVLSSGDRESGMEDYEAVRARVEIDVAQEHVPHDY